MGGGAYLQQFHTEVMRDGCGCGDLVERRAL